MAANCAEALDPLYQATLKQSKVVDRAHLYLAHCQSIFAQDANAAFNLQAINQKNLGEDDLKLYKQLMTKHKESIDAANKIYFSISPYVGQSTVSPKSLKGTGTFYGLSLGASRPTWSLGVLYESFSLTMVPANTSTYTQGMTGLQAGYFVLPSWRVSGSYTQIAGSTDQMKNISVLGVQTDYYIKPLFSVFAEYYSSNYPKLLLNKSSQYALPVGASQIVGGIGFPIVNSAKWGLNGVASYTSITVKQSNDTNVVLEKNLNSNANRSELTLNGYVGKATAALSGWSGAEVLGVRSRGSAVNNSTDRRKSGAKLGLGYYFNPMFTLGASYSSETYTAADTTGSYVDFTVATSMLNASITL